MADELRRGELRELHLDTDRRVYRIIAYSLDRRAESPAASWLKKSLRAEILNLKRAYDAL